jgi:hypothetical protein
LLCLPSMAQNVSGMLQVAPPKSVEVIVVSGKGQIQAR